MITKGFEDHEKVDDKEPPAADGQASQGLPRGRPVLRVVVGVQGDDADPDEESTAHGAQQGLLKKKDFDRELLIRKKGLDLQK